MAAIRCAKFILIFIWLFDKIQVELCVVLKKIFNIQLIQNTTELDFPRGVRELSYTSTEVSGSF